VALKALHLYSVSDDIHFESLTMDFKILVLVFAFASSSFARDHVLVAPKEIRVGVEENIVLNLHGYDGQVTINAYYLTLPQRLQRSADEVRQQFPADEPIEFSLKIAEEDIVEPVPKRKDMYVELHVEVRQSQEDITITAQMLLNYTSGYVFMMTDRPAYRPGETVKMAIAVLDQNLQLTNEETDVAVSVKTPADSGSVTVGYKDLTSQNRDYVDHEFDLASEAVTGVYTAIAKVKSLNIETSATFEVQRYVLPAFDVNVAMKQSFILPTDVDFTFTLNAKYSYGNDVYGSYYVKVELVRPGQQNPIQVFKRPARFNERATFREGTEDITIPTAVIVAALKGEETLQNLVDEGATLSIQATVTSSSDAETETDIVNNIPFTKSPYKINTDRSSRYFMAGFIYQVKADVLDRVTGMPVEKVDCQIQIGDQVFAAKSDKRGQIFHLVDTQSNVNEMQITIRTMNEAQEDVTFTAVKNTSPNYLGITLTKPYYTVEENIPIQFRFPEGVVPPQLRYYVVSRGETVASGKVDINAGHVGDKSHQIPAQQSMVPSARLIAYYIHNGQVISNSVWFDIEDVCQGNELEVQPSSKEILPETDMEVFVQGNPNSLVMVKALDRSAYFVYNDSRVDRDMVWDNMGAYDTACSREGGANSKNVFEESGMFVTGKTISPSVYSKPVCGALNRKKRAALDVRDDDEEEDADYTIKQCIADGKRMVPGDALSCDERADIVYENTGDLLCSQKFKFSCLVQKRAVAFSAGGRANAQMVVNAQRMVAGKAAPRTRFLENWIWKKVTLDGMGLHTMRETSPGQVTTYDFTAISASHENQVCVAKPATVKVFKDMFIKIHIPYSLNIMEQANIKYTLFNYNKNNKKVEIKMKHGKELCSVFAADDFHTIDSFWIEGDSSVSRYFTVMPIAKSSNVQIEMMATTQDFVEDQLTRNLRIEPRGARKYVTESFPIQDNDDFEITLNLPNDGYVYGTRQCWIYAFGNPLGPMLEVDMASGELKNLQSLIRAPGGCGEQNMIRVAPSVYVYRYNIAVNKWTAAQQQQAINQINKGYQIELGHRSTKVNLRAFAVWKNHDPSTWLNALVIKVFKEAHEVHPNLDTDPLCSALEWLLTQQAEDGHFVERKHVYHREMDGQVDEEISMTAYVTVSIQEVGEICPNIDVSKILTAKGRAFDYLEEKLGQGQLGAYALALATYAAWADVPGSALAIDSYNALWNLHQNDAARNMIHWGARGKANMIETTSYALLASVMKARHEGLTEENMARNKAVARWLISQRNENGGFQATADTIVGLQAMTEYMAWITTAQIPGPPPTDLTISLKSKVNSDWFAEPGTIKGSGLQDGLRSELKVPDNVVGPDPIRATVQGVGEGSLSYRCVYRQKTGNEFCPFNIEVETIEEMGGDVPILNLILSVSKKEEPSAGMSIVDIGLISGYEVQLNSLEDLLNENVVDGLADRYEITDKSIILYISKITTEQILLPIVLKQTAMVEHAHPAQISVYDYYEPEIACNKFYSTDDKLIVRTACSRPDENQKSICRCAEGGCMKCRSWDQIRSRTECIDNSPDCDTCQMGTENCLPLVRKACQAEFLYKVEVEEVAPEEDGFIAFTANIIRVFKSGADSEAAEDVRRTFKLRTDCHETCVDPLITDEHYIIPGRWLYISGRAPEVVKHNDANIFTYVLDATSGFIQRVVPNDKCVKAKDHKDKKNKKCRRGRLPAEVCEKLKQRKVICILQDQFEQKMRDGCG